MMRAWWKCKNARSRLWKYNTLWQNIISAVSANLHSPRSSHRKIPTKYPWRPNELQTVPQTELSNQRWHFGDCSNDQSHWGFITSVCTRRWFVRSNVFGNMRKVGVKIQLRTNQNYFRHSRDSGKVRKPRPFRPSLWRSVYPMSYREPTWCLTHTRSIIFNVCVLTPSLVSRIRKHFRGMGTTEIDIDTYP